MDIHAQIFRATPARELIVMTADGRVFSGAQKDEFLQQSKLYYVSRGRFTYSVDMRTLGPSNFKYEASSDVLKVKLPNITVRTSVYGPRERIAALALLASEGTSGNGSRSCFGTRRHARGCPPRTHERCPDVCQI
jgi:hypothetical protein